MQNGLEIEFECIVKEFSTFFTLFSTLCKKSFYSEMSKISFLYVTFLGQMRDKNVQN